MYRERERERDCFYKKIFKKNLSLVNFTKDFLDFLHFSQQCRRKARVLYWSPLPSK